jgi:hypothetical protein
MNALILNFAAFNTAARDHWANESRLLSGLDSRLAALEGRVSRLEALEVDDAAAWSRLDSYTADMRSLHDLYYKGGWVMFSLQLASLFWAPAAATALLAFAERRQGWFWSVLATIAAFFVSPNTATFVVSGSLFWRLVKWVLKSRRPAADQSAGEQQPGWMSRLGTAAYNYWYGPPAAADTAAAADSNNNTTAAVV